MCAHNLIADLPTFLQATSGQRPQRTPVWFMRQAGRSLPEYRALRQQYGGSMLQACLQPELAAEATLQPVRRHGVDAAILFSDIMVPLVLAGIDVHIEPGVGPVMSKPVRTSADIREITAHQYGDNPQASVAAITTAVQLALQELGTPHSPGIGSAPWHASAGTAKAHTPLGRELSARELAGLAQAHGQAGWTPLIAFGGAPFTLAAYLVQGRPSRDHLAARTLMHADPPAWDRLARWCAQLTGAFIATQIKAGAAAAQLFDSWAGSLCPADYRRHCAPYSALALTRARQTISPTLNRRVQLIHFGTGTAQILPDMYQAGADVIGVDERTDLRQAISLLAKPHTENLTQNHAKTNSATAASACPCPVQGNLDPARLGTPLPTLMQAVSACLEAGKSAPAHIFNLGHGVPASTDPQVLTQIVARVHQDPAWEQLAARSHSSQ